MKTSALHGNHVLMHPRFGFGFFQRGVQQKPPCFFCSGLEGTSQKSKALPFEKTAEHSGVQEKGFFWMQGEHEGLSRRQESLEHWDRPVRSVGNRGSAEITERKDFGGVTKTNCKFCHNPEQPWVTDIQSNPVKCPCLARTQCRRKFVCKLSVYCMSF